MSCSDDIKLLLFYKKMKIKTLAEEMSKRSGKKISPNFLSQKLSKGKLKYYELELICQILGYKINYEKI